MKTAVSLQKRMKCFPSTQRRRNLKTQLSPAILDLCLRETAAGKSRDYRDVIRFEKLRFPNVFGPQKPEKPAYSNPSGLNSTFEECRSSDGLMWTVGRIVEIQQRFQSFQEPRASVLTCPTPVVVNWLPPWCKLDQWPKMKQYSADLL